FASDAVAWQHEFGVAKDVSGLLAERNVFRYCPTSATVRLAESGSLTDLLRVIGAGLTAGSPFSVSSAVELPPAVASVLADRGVTVTVQTDAAWLASLAGVEGRRIRLVGAPASSVAAATDGRPDIAVYAEPVTESGRVELLPSVQEQ